MAGEPVFRHRHCPFSVVSSQASYMKLTITFSGDKGPVGPSGPKGMLLLLLLRYHVVGLTPGDPDVSPAPESEDTDNSSSWTLG